MDDPACDAWTAVGPEDPKNIPSKELWAVTGRWFVTPDSRPAAAVVSWNADIPVAVHANAAGSLPVPTLHADRDPFHSGTSLPSTSGRPDVRLSDLPIGSFGIPNWRRLPDAAYASNSPGLISTASTPPPAAPAPHRRQRPGASPAHAVRSPPCRGSSRSHTSRRSAPQARS